MDSKEAWAHHGVLSGTFSEGDIVRCIRNVAQNASIDMVGVIESITIPSEDEDGEWHINPYPINVLWFRTGTESVTYYEAKELELVDVQEG